MWPRSTQGFLEQTKERDRGRSEEAQDILDLAGMQTVSVQVQEEETLADSHVGGTQRNNLPL